MSIIMLHKTHVLKFKTQAGLQRRNFKVKVFSWEENILQLCQRWNLSVVAYNDLKGRIKEKAKRMMKDDETFEFTS